jgi:hypothetical protein
MPPDWGAKTPKGKNRMDHDGIVTPDQAIPIQRFAAAGLRVLAVMILVGGILVSAIYWVVEWQTPRFPWPLAAVIPLKILFAITIASWFWLLWRRAGMLGNLVAQDYPVMTCMATCMRLLGELIAILFVLSSLAFAILSLVAADLAAATALSWFDLSWFDLRADIVEPTTYGLAAVTALLWPIAGLAAGGFVLFGAYLFAEVLIAKLEFLA